MIPLQLLVPTWHLLSLGHVKGESAEHKLEVNLPEARADKTSFGIQPHEEPLKVRRITFRDQINL